MRWRETLSKQPGHARDTTGLKIATLIEESSPYPLTNIVELYACE